MTDFNHVFEIGRLTRDIGERDFAYTASGVARLNISIAVNRSEKRNGQWTDKANFFDVTIWGK
ncbi:MAG: single-stranded DNA-binding protein, partial [Treponema sp.]|nr:single-stranded DNA-binding protein [Treponema sp.]